MVKYTKKMFILILFILVEKNNKQHCRFVKKNRLDVYITHKKERNFLNTLN